MRNLVRHRKAGAEDFLDRVDCLGALKRTVLVTGIFRFHRLAHYLTQRTKGSVGFVLGVPLLSKILDPEFYSDLPGGILEGMGRLFLNGVKLFVHPGYDGVTGKYVTGHTLTVPRASRDLYHFLIHHGKIVDLAGRRKRSSVLCQLRDFAQYSKWKIWVASECAPSGSSVDSEAKTLWVQSG